MSINYSYQELKLILNKAILLGDNEGERRCVDMLAETYEEAIKGALEIEKLEEERNGNRNTGE